MNEWMMLSRCWRASDTSEIDDEVAASYFTHILDTCTHHTHIVSLIPQQSVLLHKEDYTSGTRGFPGMGHSHPVCHHSAGAMVTLLLPDISSLQPPTWLIPLKVEQGTDVRFDHPGSLRRGMSLGFCHPAIVITFQYSLHDVLLEWS